MYPIQDRVHPRTSIRPSAAQKTSAQLKFGGIASYCAAGGPHLDGLVFLIKVQVPVI